MSTQQDKQNEADEARGLSILHPNPEAEYPREDIEGLGLADEHLFGSLAQAQCIQHERNTHTAFALKQYLATLGKSG